MRGEIGIKIKNISIEDSHYDELNCETTNDLRINDESGDFLYIVGDNNIAKLLRNALTKYYESQRKKESK